MNHWCYNDLIMKKLRLAFLALCLFSSYTFSVLPSACSDCTVVKTAKSSCHVTTMQERKCCKNMQESKPCYSCERLDTTGVVIDNNAVVSCSSSNTMSINAGWGTSNRVYFNDRIPSKEIDLCHPPYASILADLKTIKLLC